MKTYNTIKTTTPGTALETIPGLEVPALPEKIAKIDQAGSNEFQMKLGSSFLKFREALILALRDPMSLGLGGGEATTGATSVIPISWIVESSALKVMTNLERNKLAGIENGAQVNKVTSVQGRVGGVVVSAADLGLGNVDNTSDVNKPVSTAQATAINARIPKLGYVGVSMNGASLTADIGKMYGVYATGVTITLPSATTVGDGEVIGFMIGVNAGRTLQINTTSSQNLITPEGVKTTGYAVTGFARTIYAVCYFHTWMLCGMEDSAIAAQINAAIAPLAPLASPALTGIPTAPTAAAGTNTTQIATTAFVTGAVAGVTASSIGLGSVDNTADADKPVSTAAATALALKQNASNAMTTNTTQEVTGTKTYRTSALYYGPATPVNHTPFGFGCGGVAYWGTRQYTNGNLVWQSIPTGGGSSKNALGFIFGEDGSVPNLVLYNTPTAPTAAAGTNTTQLATTAFVQAATANAIYDLPVTRSGLVSSGTDVILFETSDALNAAWYDTTHVLNVSFFAQNELGLSENTTFKVQLYDAGTSTAHTIASITVNTLNPRLLQASIYRASSSSVNCSIQYGIDSSYGTVSLPSGAYKLRVVCTSMFATIFRAAQVRFTK